VAVMYRTNAQSRALEEAFIRYGMAYKLVAGTRFYERKEVKDVIAYLRLIQNPAERHLADARDKRAAAGHRGQDRGRAFPGWAKGAGGLAVRGFARDGGAEREPEALQPQDYQAAQAIFTK